MRADMTGTGPNLDDVIADIRAAGDRIDACQKQAIEMLETLVAQQRDRIGDA